MTDTFTHGYAAVIGVDDNNIKQLALATVARDVRAVRDVLVHPERCAYVPDNVRLLTGPESTRANILAALTWLGEQAAADPDATAVLYYSGHGAVKDGQYYLIPYDVNYSSLYSDAIKAEEFNGLVQGIDARRLLVVLDCCHAAGLDAKDTGGVEAALGGDVALAAAAFPLELAAAGIGSGDKSVIGGLEDVDDLLDGEGRAVLNSSKGEQKSYLRQDRSMSLFTYHFIEALTGHAPHPDDATVVYVTDVMSWVTHEVKKSAAREGRDQTPVMRTSGVFPVAQLIGGKGVAKGLGEFAPDPLEPLPTVQINQQGQTVDGPQFVSGGAMTIGQVGDTINTGGGDYVRGNQVVNQSSGQAPAWQAAVVSLRAMVAQQAPALTGKVDLLQGLLSQGGAADDQTMAGLVQDIADGAPAARPWLRQVFQTQTPGPVTGFVLSRLGA